MIDEFDVRAWTSVTLSRSDGDKMPRGSKVW